MTKRKIYLDHNATTPLHPEVKKAMAAAMDVFGNPSSMHEFGRESKKYVEESRKKIANLIGADSDEIFFVGSGSEANNTVISIIPCNKKSCECSRGCKHEIVTSKIEHPSILETAKCIGKKGGVASFVDIDEFGKIKIEQFKNKITDNTGLVSIMMANNEIGTIQDIKKLAKIAHEKGSLFHTDAVQAAGKVPINVKDLDVDFLTLSAHKIYGPKGIGALYVKKGATFCPLIVGGHQERGRRAGTENTLGIIGFGKAVEMRSLEMKEEWQRLKDLKTFLKTKLKENIEDIYFNGHPEDCITGTLNVSFDGIEGEALLLYLDLDGIAVSTGSACASGSLDPSHVLLATGMPIERAHSSIRISMGRENTKDDIEYLVEKLALIVKRLRKMSSAY